MSPCAAPPYFCKMAFMAIIMILSTAMIANGVKPIDKTRRIILTLYPPKVMRIAGRFPKRKDRTKQQLANWDKTVATAAPVTHMFHAKMKTGSNIIFNPAPKATASMAILANP